MKQCSKCKKEKNIRYFSKDKSKKDGLSTICKHCKSNYHEKWRSDNKEHLSEYRKKWQLNQGKQYYRDNRDKIRKSSKKRYNNIKDKQWHKDYWKDYRKSNKEYYQNKGKEYYYSNKSFWVKKSKNYHNSPIKFDSKSKYRKEIELYEEVSKSDSGNLMCKCAYCGEWFEPTYIEVNNRVSAINGKYTEGSEYRLYCSQNCKNSCPIYHKIDYSEDQKPATSREVQPELRQMVFERDNYTCQKCNIHRDNLEVGIHCHHKEGILWEPLQSADIDMCITLCEDCHKELHSIDGCKYYEIRCTG